MVEQAGAAGAVGLLSAVAGAAHALAHCRRLAARQFCAEHQHLASAAGQAQGERKEWLQVAVDATSGSEGRLTPRSRCGCVRCARALREIATGPLLHLQPLLGRDKISVTNPELWTGILSVFAGVRSVFGRL